MRGRTVHALVFILALSVFAADTSVGCGQGFVIGPVTSKYRGGADNGSFLIAVNGTPYDVGPDFYNQVQIGDTVKYTGRQWLIVKTANGTVVNPPP
ncbi:MAG TPA: hypothetical protein VGA35_16225 [bacterium]